MNEKMPHEQNGMIGNDSDHEPKSLVDSAQKEKLANSILAFEKKARNGRHSLLILSVLSLVNIILMLFNANITFLFTFEIPSFVVGVCQYISNVTGNQVYLLASVIGSFLFIGFFYVLFLLSKERLWPGIVALILFIIDTLVLIVFLLFDLSNASLYIIDIAFHAWALISLSNLVRYFPKLKKAKSEYNNLYPVSLQKTTKSVTIQFFDTNPNTIREIREMDHNSVAYKKALRSVRLSLGELFPRRKRYFHNNEEEKNYRKQISKNIVAMIVSIIFMFVFIFIAALFIPDEISKFNKIEIIEFCCFLIVEMISVLFLILSLYKYMKVLNRYFSFVVDHYELDQGEI